MILLSPFRGDGMPLSESGEVHDAQEPHAKANNRFAVRRFHLWTKRCLYLAYRRSTDSIHHLNRKVERAFAR